MYVVIMGAGTVGAPLASSLVAAGHEVFVIDRDPLRAADLQARLGSVASQGDGTSFEVLTEAGTGRAALFIATTGSDADNLVGCEMAKGLFNVPRTIAVAHSPENTTVFERSGIDVVVSSGDLVLSHIAGALPAHPLLRLMPVLGRSQVVVGLKIPAGGSAVSQPVGELSLPYGARLVLIISSEGRTEVPDGDTILEAEDEVIALVPTESAGALWEALSELR
jgi:trk system potassium uptake protein TrkA